VSPEEKEGTGWYRENRHHKAHFFRDVRPVCGMLALAPLDKRRIAPWSSWDLCCKCLDFERERERTLLAAARIVPDSTEPRCDHCGHMEARHAKDAPHRCSPPQPKTPRRKGKSGRWLPPPVEWTYCPCPAFVSPAPPGGSGRCTKCNELDRSCYCIPTPEESERIANAFLKLKETRLPRKDREAVAALMVAAESTRSVKRARRKA